MTEFQEPEPQAQYEEVYVEVPQWPKVVGIFSLVWAGLGLCCTGIGIFNMLKGTPSGSGPGQMPEDLARAMEAQQYSAISIAGFVVSALSILSLVTAGVFTINRKLAGRYLHLVYAALSLVQCGLTVFGLMTASRIMQEWGAQNPTHEFAKAIGIVKTVMNVVMAVSVVMLGAYPLFLLVWFGLVKRTQSSMTGMPEVEPMAGDPTAPGR